MQRSMSLIETVKVIEKLKDVRAPLESDAKFKTKLRLLVPEIEINW